MSITAVGILMAALAACGSRNTSGQPAAWSLTPARPAPETTATPSFDAVSPSPALRATTSVAAIPSTVKTAVPESSGEPAGFSAAARTVTATELGSSYHPGCPVGPDQLRDVRMAYWGFDGTRHTGDIVVNASVVTAVITVFHRLYDERFPIRSLRPVTDFGSSDAASMAADNTSGFNCRTAVAPGPPQWSVHAYGKAIDVNTVENPYLTAGVVMPAAGAAFTDRTDVRPGMAVPGGPLLAAFATAGWYWGGRWADPDYQHFSVTGG